MEARDSRSEGRSYGAWILLGPIVAIDRPPLTRLRGVFRDRIKGNAFDAPPILWASEHIVPYTK